MLPTILIILLLATAGFAAGKSAVTPLDQRVQALLSKWKLPGASVAVVRDGKLVHARGFGYADVASRTEARAQTLFRIASVSKPLAAMATLRLMERGALHLDDPVFGYLDEWKPLLGDPRMAAITIRHLLHHSGGWDSAETGDPCFPAHADLVALGASFPPTRDELLGYVLHQPLQFDPGSREAYSNFGFVLLGRVIERVSGQPYEEAVRDLVFAPLGAGASRLGQSIPAANPAGVPATAPGLPANLEARYYDHPGAALQPSIFHPTPVPGPRVYGGFSLDLIDAAGGWVSSAPELAVTFSSVLGVPDPLLPPAIAALLSDRAPYDAASPLWYGLGVNVLETPSGELWSHAGRVDGSVSWWVRLPDNTNLVFLANSAPADLQTGEFVAEMEQTLLLALLEVTDWPTADLTAQYLPRSPMLRPDAVRNMADGESHVAPGTLVRISGSGLGPLLRLGFDPSSGAAPTELEGVSVSIGGRPAPLLSVSALAIEAIVPYGLPGNTSVPIMVRTPGQVSKPVLALIHQTAPAIFRRSALTDAAAALNSDGTENSPANPAAPGTAISLFLTGVGDTMPGLADGAVALQPGYAPLANLRIFVEGQPVPVLYTGAAPGLVNGVVQVNLLLPTGAAPDEGVWKVEVEAGDQRSLPARIFVGVQS